MSTATSVRLSREALASGIMLIPADGGEARLNHDDCGDTRSRLYVTLRGGVYLGFCHNCNARGVMKAGVTSIRTPVPEWTRRNGDGAVWASPQEFTTIESARFLYETNPARRVTNGTTASGCSAWARHLMSKRMPPSHPLIELGAHDFCAKYDASFYGGDTSSMLTYYVGGNKVETTGPYGTTCYRAAWDISESLAFRGADWSEVTRRTCFMHKNTTAFPNEGHLTIDSTKPGEYDTVVLVEDRLSAISGSICGAESDWACLWGTKLSEADLLKLVTRYRNILLWLDGDDAGFAATRDIVRRLGPLPVKVAYGEKWYEARKQTPTATRSDFDYLQRKLSQGPEVV